MTSDLRESMRVLHCRSPKHIIRNYSSSIPNGGINRYSRTVTQPKAQGASQVSTNELFGICGHNRELQAMLWATDGIEEDSDLNKAMVGVGSVW